MPAQKINGLRFSKYHIGIELRFLVMMMSFEKTMASLLNVRSRCITAHFALDHAASCRKDS